MLCLINMCASVQSICAYRTVCSAAVEAGVCLCCRQNTKKAKQQRVEDRAEVGMPGLQKLTCCCDSLGSLHSHWVARHTQQSVTYPDA
jgi:hypothetical protein